VLESIHEKQSCDHLDFTTLRTLSKQMRLEEKRGSVVDDYDEDANFVDQRTKCTFSENQTKAHSQLH